MKFDENLAAIHAYLCGDGYVIKNPKSQKNKYYYIGFRNTNEKLLKDFQRRFYKYFGINPRLILGERCVVQNKKTYEELVGAFKSFYSREWRMPKLNRKLARIWLRSFFDCEGWVFCKTRQNRHVGLDTINEKGLNQIISFLNRLKIKTIKKENKKRGIFRIIIYGKENLRKFKEKIGFLHPDKSKKLDKALEDYVIYVWIFPKKEKTCRKFIKRIMIEKCRINRKKYVRIISKEEQNLKNLQIFLKQFYNLHSLVNQRINGLGTIYYEMNINKKEDVQKLIDLKVIPNLFKS
ncbi:MAG: hypothetical protein KKB31_04505 [Nanoarchaeota archaeon]|nr:hypothetical protein [Nanoarchaeota archaeon]